MRTFSALAAAAAVAALVVVPSSSGAAGDAAAEPIEIGHIPECTEAVPAAVALPGDPISLEATVLLDGISSARAGHVMGVAARSYAPLGITLRPTYRAVAFGGDDAVKLIDQAKSSFGGDRPAGSDVVLVLTDKDIQVGGNTAVAGMADCIGGVAFADRAFAVAEVQPEDGIALGPIVLDYELSAKVAAHELGHLMGAHHHYANCVEGVPSELGDGDVVSPCTLMFNAVNPSSLNFAALNGAVVAGHAQAYAAP